jgi:hypothetical protein
LRVDGLNRSLRIVTGDGARLHEIFEAVMRGHALLHRVRERRRDVVESKDADWLEHYASVSIRRT